MEKNDFVRSVFDSSSIALITHVNPDGDAIGSSIALKHALEKMGKLVDVYCQDDIPDIFKFLEGVDRIKKADDLTKNYDLAVALDCSDRERMGTCSSVMDRADRSANIDHHVSNTFYANINVVDENASATGEIVFELVGLLDNSTNINMASKAIAVAIYTAIATDTGRFSFSNTSPKTHRIVASLIEWGVDVDRLSNLLFKSHSFEWVKLLGLVINTLEMYRDGKVAIMHISQEMMDKAGAAEEETGGIIQYAKDIYGVELAAVLREIDPSTTKVGLRSESLVDVSALAQEFGGGGHKRAAGYTIELPITQAQVSLMEAIDMHFEE
ncbi:MAG: bifunctional oligoribonuclease/PAP phosphatase NrnA [Clostridiales bacterium]|nr:bifunctional oligoribonuclease/PAP phosphatase NrnA [Clostridiales bacterium]